MWRQEHLMNGGVSLEVLAQLPVGRYHLDGYEV